MGEKPENEQTTGDQAHSGQNRSFTCRNSISKKVEVI
jgi:hypothetical protein